MDPSLSRIAGEGFSRALVWSSYRGATRGRGKPSDRVLDRQILAGVGAAVLAFDRAGGEAARSQDQLVGQADQVHRGEFGTRRFVAVVIQHLDPGAAQPGVERVGSVAALGVARP